MKTPILFLAMSVLCGCGSNSSSQPIYLGHVATTSGPEHALGEQEARGVLLATQDLARAGGRPVFVKLADAGGQIAGFESQAVRLTTLGRVVALIGGDTPEEVERLDRRQVPLLTFLGYRPAGSSKLVFAIGMTPSAQAQALARFAVLEKSAKKMAICLDERLEGRRALVDAFIPAHQKACAEKFAKESCNKPTLLKFGKDTDLADLAKRTAASQAPCVLFAGSAADYAAWRKHLPGGDMLILFGGADGSLREQSPHPAFLASAFAVDKELPKTVAFAQQYRDAFQSEPEVHAALAYDAVRLLADALTRVPAAPAESLDEEIRHIKDFPGLTGSMAFDGDQQLVRPIFVGRMNGQVFSPVKRYDSP